MTDHLTRPQSRRQFLNSFVTATFAASLAGAAHKALAATSVAPLEFMNPHVLDGLDTPLDAPVTPALPYTTQRASVTRVGEVRDLNLYNANTHETLNITFYANGSYNPQALQQLNVFLRDYHQNIPHMMDPGLLTLVHDMQRVFNRRQVQVISAYRTPQTNAQLVREHVTNAKDSFHVKGQAIDIRIPGVPTNAMRDVAKILAVGGVGYYPWAQFVHIDTGPVRYW